MVKGLSVKLPLSFDEEGGYTLNRTYSEISEQNLKNLLLTNPGERVMDSNFGVGLKTYLFEQNIDSTYDSLRSDIYEQVQKYLPFLEIDDVSIERNEEKGNTMSVKIFYTIVPLAVQTNLELFVTPNKDFI